MRRRHVFFLAIPIAVFLAVLAGWNRAAADDQSTDFRLSQIMVKLTQIEWQLTQVRNRLGSQDQRLTDIDRQLEQILEEIEEAASTASKGSTASTESMSSRAAVDPALTGTWRLARNDFAEEIPKNIRRYLEERADQADQAAVRRRRIARIDETVKKVVDYFEEILDQAGFRLIRFRPDGMYTDDTKDEGMWLVSGDRLILTTFDGRAYPCTYSVDGTDLTLTITGDQIGTLFRLERERVGAGDLRMIANSFRYTDRVRLFYTRDF